MNEEFKMMTMLGYIKEKYPKIYAEALEKVGE
jgi:hypothetical protein